MVIDFECCFSILGKQSAAVSLFCLADLSLLRSSEEQAPVPPNKFMGDIEELAASYERKLIEVSAGFYLSLYGLFIFFPFGSSRIHTEGTLLCNNYCIFKGKKSQRTPPLRIAVHSWIRPVI